MVFLTPAVGDVMQVRVVMVTFDHVTRRAALRFDYVANPVITDVQPLDSFLKYTRRHFSCLLTVDAGLAVDRSRR